MAAAKATDHRPLTELTDSARRIPQSMNTAHWLRTTSVIALMARHSQQLPKRAAPPPEQWARGFLARHGARKVQLSKPQAAPSDTKGNG